MNPTRHVLMLLCLAGTVVVTTTAQEPANHSYSSDVAKCAQNPPGWYGFDNRPDCFRNWPRGARFWDFVDDFKVGAEAQNPSPDSYGNPAVWHYRRAPSPWTPGDWSAAPLLENFGVVGDSSLGEVGWLSTKPNPFVGTFAGLHGGYAHPDVNEAAVIDWRSPG